MSSTMAFEQPLSNLTSHVSAAVEKQKLAVKERFRNPAWEVYQDQCKKLVAIEMTDNVSYIFAHLNLFSEYLANVQMHRQHPNPIKIAETAAMVEKTGEQVSKRAEHCTTQKGSFSPARVTTNEQGQRELTPSFVTVFMHQNK